MYCSACIHSTIGIPPENRGTKGLMLSFSDPLVIAVIGETHIGDHGVPLPVFGNIPDPCLFPGLLCIIHKVTLPLGHGDIIPAGNDFSIGFSANPTYIFH